MKKTKEERDFERECIKDMLLQALVYVLVGAFIYGTCYFVYVIESAKVKSGEVWW